MKSCLSHWDDIARRLTAAPRVLLALDYDGVLTPLTLRADRAHLSGPLKRLLRQMSRQSNIRFAVVSGRGLRDLRKKVPLRGVILAGNHGLNIRFPGKYERHGDGSRYRHALRQAMRRLTGLLRRFPGSFIEDKQISFGLHYRAVPVAQRVPLGHEFRRVRQAFPTTLDVIYQKLVFDVIPRVSWDKGKAVKRIWEHVGRTALPIYMGDDRTDESAFRALRGHGITILVESPRPSHAEYYLRSSKEVPRFLSRIRDLLC